MKPHLNIFLSFENKFVDIQMFRSHINKPHLFKTVMFVYGMGLVTLLL